MHPADGKVISLEDLDASLEDFRSEVTPGSPLPVPPARPPIPLNADHDDKVSLADLLAADVRIESYEAVAIVQALCALVLESRTAIGAPTPELHGMHIHSDGSVSAESVGPLVPAAAIQCLGEVLSQMLPKKDFMFLRERVVEKARSSPPYYTSVEELSDTLAYYERADRATHVRDVYRRWQNRAEEPAPLPSEPLILFGLTADDIAALASRYAYHAGIALLVMVPLVGFLMIGSESNKQPAQPQSASAIHGADRVPEPERPRQPIVDPLREPVAEPPSPASLVAPQPSLPAPIARIQPPSSPTTTAPKVTESRLRNAAPVEADGRRAPTRAAPVAVDSRRTPST